MPVPLMNFTISFAFSAGIPFWIVTAWRTVPLAAGSILPYWSAFRETPRFTSLVVSTSITALRRDSSSEFKVRTSPSRLMSLTLPLKSNRCLISFIACCTAFEASIMLTSETTSNEFEPAIDLLLHAYSAASAAANHTLPESTAQEDREATLEARFHDFVTTLLYANCLRSGRAQVAPALRPSRTWRFSGARWSYRT